MMVEKWNKSNKQPLCFPYVQIHHAPSLTCAGFQVLMATISLRRTKDKGIIGLPQKTIETFCVDLSKEERELYDQMERAAKNVVQGYINAGGPTCNYTTVLSIILRLRQICTDLALCPSDIKSLLPSNNIEGMVYPLFGFFFLSYIII